MSEEVAANGHAIDKNLHPLLKAHALSASRRQMKSALQEIDWVQELQRRCQTVLTYAAMEDGQKVPGVDPDHMFSGMLRQELIDDIIFLFDDQNNLFHTIISLGTDIAGHPRITHGGFTSAVMDEATGGLVYALKNQGQLGEGPAFTARLEVNYRKPLPTNIVILCTAKVDNVEGRKIWTSAEMRNKPEGFEDSVMYAEGRALYVTARSQG